MLALFLGGQELRAEAPELTPDQEIILERVRDAALQYTQRLPDFICTQTNQREFSNLNDPLMGLTGVSTPAAASQMSTMTQGETGANSLTCISRNYALLLFWAEKISVGFLHLITR